MAVDLDQFPTDDDIVDKDGKSLSAVWIAAFSSFQETLSEYLTQYGIFMPKLTTEQRDTIQSPQNGQMIYNTTLDTAQYFKAGVWTSF